MEPDIEPAEAAEELETVPLVPLYSSQAIKWFSIIFSPIAGGIMTSQNLKDIGQPLAASNALLGGIGFTIAVVVFAYLTNLSGGFGGSFFIGYLGAFGLEFYFSYFVKNRDAFPAKSITKALIISLSILAIFLALVYYSIVHMQQPVSA
ncbi:hypothetical protein JAO73_03660 [Hymenobacter sp. BT523]|uniref:hypothetical protein n=1 Tax=Hymenobacter sp. BT523 TaxID=2795725 RepID=UPI0018EC2CFE|nr:hypothetical protein [Hymenobacter sp. BT523]MBJ6108094.1 hypothetical protein [Hymenobacter sp. BT523]